MIFIPKDNIDTKVWDISDKFLNKKDNVNLKLNNYIKILVVNKRINQGDHQIKVIGNLLDFATEDEVSNYYGSIISTDVNTETEDNGTSENQSEDNYII